MIKNKVDDVGGTGISLSEDLDAIFTVDARLERNSVSRCGSDGISVQGSEVTLIRNRVTSVEDDGFETRNASLVHLEKNASRFADADGFDLVGTQLSVESNKVTRSGDDGFDVTAGNNTFIRNQAKKSFDLDLIDEIGPPSNAYSDNVFKTTNNDV